MTPAEVDEVHARLRTVRSRVKVLQLAGGRRVVVKRVRAARPAWRARLMNGLARLAGLGFLQATPGSGGAAAQSVEVGRLRALGELGVHVPRVLHEEADFFVMGHIEGPNLAQRIEAGGDSADAAWRLGLATLLEVHRRGAWLGQAFARNFIVAADGSLAMIDFEDDPGSVMSPADAQARDWLSYLHSTAWLLVRPPEALRAEVLRALDGESPAVRALVLRAGRHLAAARHLPATRRPFGREAAGLQALAAVLAPRADRAPAQTRQNRP